MATALSGLSILLTALSQGAHPDEVASAMVKGPGSAFDAASAAILWRRGDELVVLGLHGYRASEVDGLAAVSLQTDYPLVRAFWDGTTLVESVRDISDGYEGARRPESRWRNVAQRLPDGCTVSAPIVSDGRPIGAYALNCATDRAWSSSDIAVLDAASSALGLWLTHPDSGLPLARLRDTALHPALSPRQIAILHLICQGRTNTSIAATLGVSVSTVKQDLTRAMAHLDASDRAEAAETARSMGVFEGLLS